MGYENNIWNKEGFRMCGFRANCRILATIKHVGKCIKCVIRQIKRGLIPQIKNDFLRYAKR